MKFVVLCGGAGTRLAQSNGFPKPWNLVLRVPMLQYVLEQIPSNEVTLVVNKDLAYLNLETVLPHYVNKTFNVLYLERATRGALETAYLGLQLAKFSDDESVCFLDNDTVYSLGSVQFPEQTPFIGVSTATESRPYCYVKMDTSNRMTELAEKRCISQTYACGVYGVSRVGDFCRIAKTVLVRPKSSPEFYMSSYYETLS